MMNPRGQFDVTVLTDVRIRTPQAEGTLAADVFLPATAEQVPALVTLVPYRKDAWAGMNYGPLLRSFAARGYACLLVDMRGTGSSDGPLRPPFDAGEADEAVAAIEWAAAQPWCDGNVGMWGLSYAAMTALRAASRRPPQLKAIIPAMSMIDPERDWVHPGGAQGGLAARGSWAAHNLKLQLLPPLAKYHSAEEQRRWRQRMRDTEHAEPYIVDMFRHPPGDAAWQARRVDTSAIVAPALCIGGWRDVFCDATVRAYEQLQGPKRLLVGPWTHVLPHRSAVEPVDFLALAGRWWDRWLRGIDNGVDEEPPVVLYTHGHEPRWQAFESWPPPADETLVSTDDGGLTPSTAEYRPDPTTGVLSGLWFAGIAGFGAPLDQHEDDSRAAGFTSDPLAEDVVVVGRPSVTVRLAPDEDDAGSAATRIVVRLAEVDDDGRSTFVTGGLVSDAAAGNEQRVDLAPTAYRVPAGHRLRVVVSDADFPRLWPVADGPVLRITGVRLHLPVPAPGAGTTKQPPLVDPGSGAAASPAAWEEPRWTITREPVLDGLDVVVGRDVVTRTPDGAHLLESHQHSRARVQRCAPEAADMHVTDSVVVRMRTGTQIEVVATATLTHAWLRAHGEVIIDGSTVFSRTWEA